MPLVLGAGVASEFDLGPALDGGPAYDGCFWARAWRSTSSSSSECCSGAFGGCRIPGNSHLCPFSGKGKQGQGKDGKPTPKPKGRADRKRGRGDKPEKKREEEREAKKGKKDLRFVVDGKQLCFTFNRRSGCKRAECKFLHQCAFCQKVGHGAHDCPARR